MDARGMLDLLDLTLLDHAASRAELDALCERANEHRPAAVCVFSEHVAHVRSRLDDGIPVAAVAAGFPVGESDPDAASEAIHAAVLAGAAEIDCVLEPREDEDFPGEPELAMLIAMREASSGCVLKVIIETPLLDERSMRATARMALAAGADFVKSCTGKRGGCSDEAAGILAFEVMRHGVTMGSRRGIKLSGGIRTLSDVERILGSVENEDPTIKGSDRLRIGASSLLDELVG
jgi:deoxyribose-phosphate aldolase